MKKVIIDEKGKKLYWTKGDLHTSQGIIKEKDMKQGKANSHLGKKFILFDASFVDKTEKLKRGPATITKKDIATILTYTGIDKDTKIVEAGTGSGMLAAFLAHISDHVITYEIKKEHYELAKKNFTTLGLTIKTKHADITQGIAETNVDVIILDMLHPEHVLTHAYKALVSGGYCVCYVPHVTQITALVKEAEQHDFYVEQVLETLERSWVVEGHKARPGHHMLGHTGFLIFLRKY